MNREAFITYAVTGAGDTAGKQPAMPVAPKDIAAAAIEAAKAGAAVARSHVRDPKLFREVVDRVRSAGVDVLLNLTAGNVRVGLEDNLHLEKGVFASDGGLVERAVTILQAMNVNILGPDAVREKLKLAKRG